MVAGGMSPLPPKMTGQCRYRIGALGPLLRSKVRNDRHGRHRRASTTEGAELHGARAEDARRTHDTPNDRGGVEDAGTGAGISVLLVRLADILDGSQSPVEYGNLDNRRPRAGDRLSKEGNTGLERH